MDAANIVLFPANSNYITKNVQQHPHFSQFSPLSALKNNKKQANNKRSAESTKERSFALSGLPFVG
jgi:hypothetical protein